MGKTHTKPQEVQDKPTRPKRQGESAVLREERVSSRKSWPSEASADDPRPSASFAPALVAWYRRVHRKLPWRAEPGTCHDPYRTWLSEIMLQQTTVVTVIPYYQKFLERWPTVFDLAQADESDVLREWAGLGYYARGRNLLKGARMVVADYDGVFPADLAALQKIPGIGPYTASAVGAMAFGLETVPVDGNVERVMTRICAISESLPMSKPLIKKEAQAVLDASSPAVFAGDLAQAFMDLGATVCTPKSPKCGLCPVRDHCAAHRMGTPEQYPVMAPKVDKPTRQGRVFLIENTDGKYAVTRRPGRGLLAGMVAFPTIGWDDHDPVEFDKKMKAAQVIGQVRHSFTHFNLVLDVVHGRGSSRALPDETAWYDADELTTIGLPKVFLKAVGFIQRKVK